MIYCWGEVCRFGSEGCRVRGRWSQRDHGEVWGIVVWERERVEGCVGEWKIRERVDEREEWGRRSQVGKIGCGLGTGGILETEEDDGGACMGSVER